VIYVLLASSKQAWVRLMLQIVTIVLLASSRNVWAKAATTVNSVRRANLVAQQDLLRAMDATTAKRDRLAAQRGPHQVMIAGTAWLGSTTHSWGKLIASTVRAANLCSQKVPRESEIVRCVSRISMRHILV
jgi:hypothetical protein